MKENFDTTFSRKNPAIPSSRENSGFSPKIGKIKQKKHEKNYKNSKIGEIKIDIKFFFIGGNGRVSKLLPAKNFFSALGWSLQNPRLRETLEKTLFLAIFRATFFSVCLFPRKCCNICCKNCFVNYKYARVFPKKILGPYDQ